MMNFVDDLRQFKNRPRVSILRTLLLGCAVGLISTAAQAVTIFTNPINDANPSSANPFTSGQTFDSNITVSGIGRGTGITANSASNRYNATGWNSVALDTNDFYTWTLTPNATFKIDFNSLTYTGQASGTGPVSFGFRSSVDGFAGNIGSPTAAGTTISLSALAYQGITSAITFRLYGFGATAAGGTFSVNDFTFDGTVSAASSVANVVWNTGSGTWNTTSNNWTGGSPDVNKYVEGDNATFNNVPAGGTVTIQSGGVSPGATVVNNDVAHPYAFTGLDSNGIKTGTLNKSGVGTLTLLSQNLYAGGTTVSGGILSFSDDNQLGASGGITLGGGTLSNTASISSTRSLTLTSATNSVIDTAAATTFSIGGLTGGGTLAKNGTGTLNLTAAATGLTGILNVNNGVLRVSQVDAIDGATVNVNAATLELVNLTLNSPTGSILLKENGAKLLASGGASTYSASNFPSIAAGKSVEFSTATATDSLQISSAVRDGDASSLISITGPGKVILNSGSTSGTAYAGSWRLVGSTDNTILRIQDVNGLGSPGGAGTQRPITLQKGILELGNNASSSFTTATTISGNSTISPGRFAAGTSVTHTLGTLTFSDGLGPVNPLKLTVITGTNLNANNSGSLIFTATTLTDNTEFELNNVNGSAVGSVTLGAVTGGGSLTKSGAGTLILSGAGSYTGTTLVSGGILQLTSTGTIASSPTISVAAGATFDVSAVSGFSLNTVVGQTLTGNGTVLGTLTAATGTSITPGNSVGMLTIGGLTLSPGSILNYEFNTSPANDLINTTLSGALTINGGGLNLYQEGGVTPFSTDGTYNLISYSSGFTGLPSNLSVLNPQGGKLYSFSSNGSSVQLTIATVPEPNAAGLLAFGALGLAGFRRCRR